MGFFDELKDKAEEFGDKAKIRQRSPVGATEPAVAAVEEATAAAQESAQGTGEALDATEHAASSVDQPSQDAAPDTRADSATT